MTYKFGQRSVEGAPRVHRADTRRDQHRTGYTRKPVVSLNEHVFTAMAKALIGVYIFKHSMHFVQCTDRRRNCIFAVKDGQDAGRLSGFNFGLQGLGRIPNRFRHERWPRKHRVQPKRSPAAQCGPKRRHAMQHLGNLLYLLQKG